MVEFLIEELRRLYPDAGCSLEAEDPFRMLVCARLAAQCTDARVNKISGELFGRYPDYKAFADAEQEELEKYIYSCGLYKTKARDIIRMAKALGERYGGVVPNKLDDLLTLPGVGRKIANLIIGDVFGGFGIVTDTHCIRLSNRLGLADSTNPLKVERKLSAIVPPEEQSAFCHRLVFHGRKVCMARNPKCSICTLKNEPFNCPYEIKS